jgi:DHA1 family bicyclomycin/chloramphenicol resistance-like MFS transporter
MVGLGLGQLLIGPISDALGRRRPLLIGVSGFIVASGLCALAPSIWTLLPLRFVQGIAGAAGIVIARAVVRDLYSGNESARMFSWLALVFGLSPIAAPIIGAQLLHITSWRGVFAGLAAIAGLILIGSWLGLPETLPPQYRRPATLAAGHGMRLLAHDRMFLGYTLSCSFYVAALFAYLAGSPYVLQDVYGVSPQVFSVLFAINALGEVTFSQIGGALVRRVGARSLLTAGVLIGTCGGVGLVLAVMLHAGVAGAMVCMFAVISGVGLVIPNGSALALADHPEIAGTASAILGVGQFVIGGAAMPLVGVGGVHDALPMALTMAAATVASLLALQTLATGRRAAALARS